MQVYTLVSRSRRSKAFPTVYSILGGSILQSTRSKSLLNQGIDEIAKVIQCVMTVFLEEQEYFSAKIVGWYTVATQRWNIVVDFEKVNNVGRCGVAFGDDTHHSVSVVFHYFYYFKKVLQSHH